jgi:hypothetical protein
MKILVVDLDGRDGQIWRCPFSEIAANRVKHFMEATEANEGTDQHKKLIQVSERQAEVMDWARRVYAPEKLRASWWQARITVEDVADASDAPVPVSQATLTPQPKRRGRPAKVQPVEVPAETPAA